MPKLGADQSQDIEDGFQGGLEMRVNHVPQQFGACTAIVMSQYVARSADAAPRDIRYLGLHPCGHALCLHIGNYSGGCGVAS